jgi:hypothetical protein
MMLAGTCLLGLLPGSYYLWWHRRMGDRPEDRKDATVEEGEGQIATFPNSSIWPFVPAVGLMLTALVGVTAESRRGGHV